MYVSDVAGEAVISTPDSVQDLNKRAVYTAEGTVIETKKAGANAGEKSYSTMVYSNGTGAFFDADTRVEVKRFVQEPFTPTRSDIDVEPSVSQTQAFVARGTVGLCTSKPVAGSTMTYQTPHASVNIRGQKVVIEAGSNVTKISMLEGESTVRAGAQDLGGRTLHSGEQAIITGGGNGQPSQIKIGRIPPSEAAQLDDKVAMACMARRTVYFEERVRTVDTPAKEVAADATSGDTKEKDAAASPQEKAAAAANDSGERNVTSADQTASTGGNARVAAFDAPAANATSRTTTTERVLVPVEVVPVKMPTEYVVSPSRLSTPTR